MSIFYNADKSGSNDIGALVPCGYEISNKALQLTVLRGGLGRLVEGVRYYCWR